MSTAEQPQAPSLRVTVIVAYALFLLGLANGITAVAGLVLAYIKRPEARGTVYDGHFANLIFVFWTTLACGVLFGALILCGVAGALGGVHAPTWTLVVAIPLLWICGVALFVWYVYRVIRGLIRAADAKPYS